MAEVGMRRVTRVFGCVWLERCLSEGWGKNKGAAHPEFDENAGRSLLRHNYIYCIDRMARPVTTSE
jgi:hypothetical protein